MCRNEKLPMTFGVGRHTMLIVKNKIKKEILLQKLRIFPKIDKIHGLLKLYSLIATIVINQAALKKMQLISTRDAGYDILGPVVQILRRHYLTRC